MLRRAALALRNLKDRMTPPTAWSRPVVEKMSVQRTRSHKPTGTSPGSCKPIYVPLDRILPPPPMTLALPPPAYSNKVDARRHPNYYFEDGNLSILASDVLFRVWSGLFRAPYSKAFVKMYPGFSSADDKTPLRLDRVSAQDFERFLWVLQPLTIGECRAKTVDDWIAVLKLSTLWEFVNVRRVAIKELGALEMDPVHKIVTQMRYDIEQEWSFGAFDALCRRSEPLNIGEGGRLGVEVLAKVAATREKLSATWTKPENIVRQAWV